MNDEELNTIKAKISKLLALSKSSNENEAATAMMKANALMEQYHLSEQSIKEYAQEVIENSRMESWKKILFGDIAWLYACSAVRDRRQGYQFVGEKIDSFLAKEMYTYLSDSINRLANSRRMGTKERNSYKLGLAANICRRIRSMGDAVSWAPDRDKNIRETKKWIEKTSGCRLSTHKVSASASSNIGLRSGMIDGDNISLNRQTGSDKRYCIA